METPVHLHRRIVREIESRKQAESLLELKSQELYLKNEQLEASHAKLRKQVEVVGVILDAVPDVVITCNEDLLIETVNSSCFHLLGYQANDIVGKQVTDLIPALADYQRTLAKNAFIISDISVLKHDKTSIEAELRGRRTDLYDKPMIVIVLHDVSERKASERMKERVYGQLHESRRLEALGTLASGIAHELNTPIQFIGDNVKFIGLSLDKIHASYELYDQLKIQCKKQNLLDELAGRVELFNNDIDLASLIKEISAAMQETMEGIKQVRDIVLFMKEFAHPGTGDPEATDINRVIQGALTICRSRTKNTVSIKTHLSPSLPEIICHRGQIQQVLMNLILNAVEALEEKGMKTAQIEIVTQISGSNLRIEVNDTGPGVPSALREKIFDPFFTTKQVGKGTGQGLALAKDVIVKQHGGRLFLDEKTGFSTSFVIELPVFSCAMPGSGESPCYAAAQ
jgi:PAS domain S-box-containing protein